MGIRFWEKEKGGSRDRVFVDLRLEPAKARMSSRVGGGARGVWLE